MKYPKSVNVLGKKIGISKKLPAKYKNSIDINSYQGLYFSDLRKIWINPNTDDFEMANVTCIHEINHAIMDVTGLSQVIPNELQEIICESFANFYNDYVDFVDNE